MKRLPIPPGRSIGHVKLWDMGKNGVMSLRLVFKNFDFLRSYFGKRDCIRSNAEPTTDGGVYFCRPLRFSALSSKVTDG